MPALIRKNHETKVSEQKKVVMWGTGKPMKDILYVDDCADAYINLMNQYSEELHVNIGTGEDIELEELMKIIIRIIGYEGDIQ